ncbi:hypothetical protein BDV33DRAFT_183896 [Aspergillus novoparasiticus]|uniref:Uncharacterized protein n=1 Tax=Aspergillus novoparasiticus TaxID=986946 RepID=A0A5N6E8C6_9EURO|nr:hypothetical protein BDV33DRAFT_183896 [Aspergillus novoparasiticus]
MLPFLRYQPMAQVPFSHHHVIVSSRLSMVFYPSLIHFLWFSLYYYDRHFGRFLEFFFYHFLRTIFIRFLSFLLFYLSCIPFYFYFFFILLECDLCSILLLHLGRTQLYTEIFGHRVRLRVK